MDDLSIIDNFEDLNFWINKKIKTYNKVYINISAYKDIIFPNNKLNSLLKNDKEYNKLGGKIDEIKRNCKIVFRKINIYYDILESDEEFDIVKEYCLEIQELHRKYAKTWNEASASIKSAVKYIQEKGRE